MVFCVASADPAYHEGQSAPYHRGFSSGAAIWESNQPLHGVAFIISSQVTGKKGQGEAADGWLSDHAAKLIKIQNLLIEVARDNKQMETDSFHMMGSSRTKDAFPVNSYVLYKPPHSSRTKLQMPRAGPFIVVGAVEHKFSIQDLLARKVIDTHVSNLVSSRPYSWPVDT